MSKFLAPFLKILTPLLTAKLDKPSTLKISKGGGLKREYCLYIIYQFFLLIYNLCIILIKFEVH